MSSPSNGPEFAVSVGLGSQKLLPVTSRAHEEELTVGIEDLVSKESAVVAAATAAAFSPRTRDTLRRGAVLGVAGALKVGDVVAGAARGATRGVRGQEKVPTPDADGGNRATSRSPSRRTSSSGTRRSRSSSSS
jgi:hypothetical protein